MLDEIEKLGRAHSRRSVVGHAFEVLSPSRKKFRDNYLGLPFEL